MTKLQRLTGLLGALLLLIAFLTGGLLAAAMTGKVSADAHVVLAAHMNAILGCFWLCGLAATLPFVHYGPTGAKRLVIATAIPAYANWAVTTLKAFLHVAGIDLTGNAANDVVFALLNVLVVLPSLASTGAWVYGLAKERAAAAAS